MPPAKKSTYIHIRATPEERRRIKALADAAGRSVSNFLIYTALQITKEEKKS